MSVFSSARVLSWETRAERNLAAQSVDLYVFNKTTGEHADEILVKKHEPGELMSPVFRMNESEAQQLMDDLYRAGFRPTQGRETDATRQASAAHIADLQRLLAQALPAALREPTPSHGPILVKEGPREIIQLGKGR